MTLETMINGMGGVSSSPYSAVPRIGGRPYTSLVLHSTRVFARGDQSIRPGIYRLAILPNALLSLALEANDEFRLSHREYLRTEYSDENCDFAIQIHSALALESST